MKSRRSLVAALCTLALLAVSSPIALAQGVRSEQSSPIARGPRVSGVVRYLPQVLAASPSASITACPRTDSTDTNGNTHSYGTNYVADCEATTGLPVNETAIATGTAPDGSFLEVAGANDYNSYNGQGQDGFYTSTDGVNWTDTGPIDVFPHNRNNGAGDPGVAIGNDGTVYYSSLFFNFNKCNVGGVELLRGTPTDANGGAAGYTWSVYQVMANSRSSLQDKPALAYDSTNNRVLQSWTQFGSCTGTNTTSPIQVAIFAGGGSSSAPLWTGQVQGSTYSEGASIAPDGNGGFWIAWEEWPNATATIGAIELDHYSCGTTDQTFSCSLASGPTEISDPATFADLPNPLPGFAFRTNSLPVLTVVGGTPYVTWAADALETTTIVKGHGHKTTTQTSVVGPGQVYLSVDGAVGTTVTAPPANANDAQFFPAITPDASGGVDISYCQTDSSTGSYDAYLVTGLTAATGDATASKVSTASSYPGQDALFGGQFIGDYTAIADSSSHGVQPTWTDIRGLDPNYPGYETDAVVNTP